MFGLRNSLWVVSARASCKFVLPKEMFPFFLLAGENIIEKHISANPVCGTNIKAPEPAVKVTVLEESPEQIVAFAPLKVNAGGEDTVATTGTLVEEQIN